MTISTHKLTDLLSGSEILHDAELLENLYKLNKLSNGDVSFSGLIHFEHILFEIGLGQPLLPEGLELEVVLEALFASFERIEEEIKGEHTAYTQNLNNVEARNLQQIRHRIEGHRIFECPLQKSKHYVQSQRGHQEPNQQDNAPGLHTNCDLHSHDDYDTGVDGYFDEVKACLIRAVAAGIIIISNCVEGEYEADDSLAEAEEEPGEEDEFSKEFVLLADEVHLGVVGVEGLLLVRAFGQFLEGRFGGIDQHIDLEDCADDYWEQREYHIVEGYRPAQPKGLPRAHAVETVNELHSREDHVFVEEVQDHLRNADVVQPTVIEQQLPQQAELTNGVVSHLGSPGALFSKDANPNVGLHYHVYVVGPVPDGQGQLAHIFDEADDFSLLSRGNSAENY